MWKVKVITENTELVYYEDEERLTVEEVVENALLEFGFRTQEDREKIHELSLNRLYD